jgi:Mg-chelatase subunit ChlD
LTLGGRSSVGVALRLRTDDGDEVPMSFGPGDATGSVTYLAGVEPGGSYLVEVAQPQSSVVVSFDSSASVATHLAAIESGLRSISEGMAADREALRIAPFDGEPLLPDWSSDGYEIADAVNRFSLGESSSAAEANLRQATLDLAAREGGRAVLLVTDAASSSFDETERLWGALASFRPRVFAVEVGGEDEEPAIVRHHLMADWAGSAGGQASHARGSREIQQGFDRLATWLRRPVAYTLRYETAPEEQPPLPPGRLSVQAPEIEGRRPAVLGGDAVVELVVDTSGSMRKRLGDQTRIDIAKAVLTGLVRDDLPVGAPVALRQFPPASDPCGSHLLIPPGPLDPPSAASAIAALTAPKDARTPLAQAIASAADDLRDVAGRRIVVVVSDGKESCKGDPAAELERLRAAGYDITLNVVGLTLDRASRKGIARLADLGGGSYFDAGDAETLGAALRAAVSAPVQVLDDSGAVVASSSVGGEAIDVPPGTYDISVLLDQAFTFEDVYVQPEANIVLTLPIAGLGDQP